MWVLEKYQVSLLSFISVAVSVVIFLLLLLLLWFFCFFGKISLTLGDQLCSSWRVESGAPYRFLADGFL